MVGILILIGLFIAWLIFDAKREKKLEAERAEKKRWLNTPEGKAEIERQEKERGRRGRAMLTVCN